MPQPPLDIPFQPPKSPTQFSAIGYLFGQFEAVPPLENQSMVKGDLHLIDGVKLRAKMGIQVWLRLTQKPTFNLDQAHLWRVYFRTTPEGQLTQLQLIKRIFVEDKLFVNELPPPETGVDQFQMRGRIVYADEKKVVMRLERNENPPPGQEQSPRWQPFLMTVVGSLPQAQKGQFWELLCTRHEDGLVLSEATWIDETIPVPQPAPTQATPISNQKPSSEASSTALSSSPVIMIAGRQPEMTVKFNTRPELPEQGKTVTLEVSGEGGITVRATLNRKTLKKQVEKMDSLADWVAALSGKVARIGSDGVIELEGAGVTVFEKKKQAGEEKADE